MKPTQAPLEMWAKLNRAAFNRMNQEARREVRAAGAYRLDPAHEVRPLITARGLAIGGAIASPIVAIFALGIWKAVELIGGLL